MTKKRAMNHVGKVIASALCGISVIACGTLGASSTSIVKPQVSAGNAAKSIDKSQFLMPTTLPDSKKNPMTPERVDLGKHLFFDPRLSGSNFMSCATCHNPAMGWSDGQPTAVGNSMHTLSRATPTILNIGHTTLQMWDGRIRTLDKQGVGPIQAAGEMNQDMNELILELNAIDGYVDMFQKAYPDEGITSEIIGKALAVFQRTIVSTEAPLDRWIKGDESAISESAKRGFKLFNGKANCVVCHDGFNFTDNGFHNVGLEDQSDLGRYNIRKVSVLKGAFKTPTLRDIEITAPYMHDGSLKTLDEVMVHYDIGGVNKKYISPNMKVLNLTDQEKTDVVEFMLTLTSDHPIKMSIPQLPY